MTLLVPNILKFCPIKIMVPYRLLMGSSSLMGASTTTLTIFINESNCVTYNGWQLATIGSHITTIIYIQT